MQLVDILRNCYSSYGRENGYGTGLSRLICTADVLVESLRCSINRVLLGRVALVRGAAAYSDQTFPSTICRSVGASVCPVHCDGKTADRMPFGIIGRTGPGMRQVVGFGDRSTGRGTFAFWERIGGAPL